MIGRGGAVRPCCRGGGDVPGQVGKKGLFEVDGATREGYFGVDV